VLNSREDFTKYPFIKEAIEYVKKLDLRIDELSSPDYARIVERAKKRIEEALIYGIIQPSKPSESELEIFSFPVAIFLISKINDNYLNKRFALAEAKRIFAILVSEDDKKILEIAKNNFGWKTKIEHSNKFLLSLGDYLKNSTNFHDDKWKLINQTLVKGEILLGKEEFARLLQEEVRRHIESLIDKSPPISELREPLIRITEQIRQILSRRRKQTGNELPKNIVSSAYPPCIKKLYGSLINGEHISHMGRFTLTSFLLNIGMTIADLTKLYSSFSDYDKEQTQYQIEHIAGKKGSRQIYNPPNCKTLQTHNLCFDSDEICTSIKNLLSYYKKKLNRLKI